MVNNFDVLKQMSLQNKDIRMGTDVLKMRKVKAGSQVQMGIAGDVVTPVFTGEMRACLLVFNVRQFDEVKSAMEAEASHA